MGTSLHKGTMVLCLAAAVCLLLTALSAWGCPSYRPVGQPSYEDDGDESGDIWRYFTLWGRREVTTSQHYVSVEVWAYAVRNPLGSDYIAHEETAHGWADQYVTLEFRSPGPYKPKPRGMHGKGRSDSTCYYHLADLGGASAGYTCTATFENYGMPTSQEASEHWSHTEPQSSTQGTLELSAIGADWVRVADGETVRGAGVSATVSANNGVGGCTTIYAEGENPHSDGKWGGIWGTPYY